MNAKMMEKKEEVFQKVLFDFIALLPSCVYEVNDSLVWGEKTKDCYYYHSFPSSKKVLEECGIDLCEDFHRGASNGRHFLCLSMNLINVGDGWISFQGDEISILYDYWDVQGVGTEHTDGDNINSLKVLFAQYLETRNGGIDDLDIDYCIERFGGTHCLHYRKSITCIDEFLQKFRKYYIFQTHISKANFLRICGKDSYLRLGATKSGELVWDILAFEEEHIDFQDCYYKNQVDGCNDIDGFLLSEADDRLSRQLYYTLHFEPYMFGKKVKEKVLELSHFMSKKKMKLNHPKADDDISCLKKNLTELVSNVKTLFEIKEYQSRFFPKIVQYCQSGNRVFYFLEDASHLSDYSYNKMGEAHQSFLVWENKKSDRTRLLLVPSNDKYATYIFYVENEYVQIAIALITAYFNSCIENKREKMLIKSLFRDFGIIKLVK